MSRPESYYLNNGCWNCKFKNKFSIANDIYPFCIFGDENVKYYVLDNIDDDDEWEKKRKHNSEYTEKCVAKPYGHCDEWKI